MDSMNKEGHEAGRDMSSFSEMDQMGARRLWEAQGVSNIKASISCT